MIELIMKMFFKHCILIAFVCLSFFAANGQKDSLVMNNGDIMVGEIKSMDKGILFIAVSYTHLDVYKRQVGVLTNDQRKSQFGSLAWYPYAGGVNTRPAAHVRP